MKLKQKVVSLLKNSLPFGYLKSGKGKTRVELVYLKTPGALTAYYFGGKPHLWAVTAGVHLLSKKMHRTVCLNGHRDDTITKRAEEILCKNRNGLVITGAGIHYKNATVPQIRSLVKNADVLSHRLVRLQ